ncbi:prephenate/arogenate dehydrogenase [Picosynechococcus sp. NKBG15041c]|uniref:prephenate/arogenate dehydrogenase n=1 Tax=Picosynechococcus sp. NKBG15041c TaxID=1407650 RepID=UPI00041B606D|nr:prephenate/arogenate dehydrogenase [Picosynechococcus sp. NKBG15041c]
MKIGIVGLGLIGGSLAIAFREKGLEVLGVSRKATTCETALAKGIVTRASTEMGLLQTADVVFLCAPIKAIVPTAQALIPHLKPTTILTDVASVKGEIVQAIAPLWPNFVGGHPMAGTAEQGIDAAIPGLFIDAPYVVTPTPETPPDAVETLKGLIALLQSRFYCCAPQIHDQAVAWISHLPVYVSASLIAACGSETNSEILQMAQAIASSGFRDTSRVGGGNPELGLMMAQGNRQALLNSLAGYRAQLDQAIALIEQEDWEAIANLLATTQQQRPSFL